MKTIKQALTLLIILINTSIGLLGLYFCLEEMVIHAIITLFLFVLLQPLSFNIFDKLNYEDRIKKE